MLKINHHIIEYQKSHFILLNIIKNTLKYYSMEHCITKQYTKIFDIKYKTKFIIL